MMVEEARYFRIAGLRSDASRWEWMSPIVEQHGWRDMERRHALLESFALDNIITCGTRQIIFQSPSRKALERPYPDFEEAR
jgi:hypothetical protein